MSRGSVFRLIAPLFASAALATGLGCSDQTTADPNAKMREIYYLSDLAGDVRPVVSYVEQALGQQTQLFTPEQLEIAREVVQRELNAKKLEQAVLERLAEQPQREHADAAIAWLARPAVRQFMQAKLTAYSREGHEAMKTYAEKLKESPPSKERIDLIARFDASTNSSGLAAETMLLSGYAIAVMYDALKPVAEQTGPSALRESMISQRPELEPIFKETALFTIGFSFRNLADAKALEIVEFVESEAGQWLYKTTASNFLNALLGVTANIGSIYSIALPEQHRSLKPPPEPEAAR